MNRRTLPPGYYADAGPTSAQQQLEVTLGSGSGSGRTASGNEDDIMLTWSAGDEIHGPAPAVLAMMDPQPAEPPAPAIPTILPPRSPSPSYRPPRYDEAQRPTKKIRYTFSSIAHNAMVLVPPSEAQDTRPPYYITVSMNCFMPLSHVTTIYRGANEYGVVVAAFEMGIIDAGNRIQVGDTTNHIPRFLLKERGRVNGLWTWTPPREQGPHNLRMRIHWDYSNRRCICTSTKKSKVTVLAEFVPHLGPSILKPESVLEVTPAGQEYFDDLLTSLLIVERKRLSPTRDAVLKSLFN